jgi:AcrR family transcriptional regulator
MVQLSKKKQEIQDRESELLNIAQGLLIEKGFNGLTMETLADKTEYSKGTIYQHFSSKEDVFASLCIKLEDVRFDLVRRASLFRGRSRERVIALGLAHDLVYRLHPSFWRLEQMVSLSSIREKLSAERRDRMDSTNERTFGVVLGVIRDGIAAGDLTPPSDLSPEQVFLGLVSSVRGLFSTWSADWWDRSWVPDFWDTHQKLVSAVCDGLCWRPYGNEWDYPATVKRIWDEVFPEEYAKLRQ